MSSRFTFPPGLHRLTVSLVGRDGISYAAGVEGLGHAGGRASTSLRDLHADLVRRGLYQHDFDTWFPAAGLGYDQAYVTDLSMYKIRAAVEMKMKHEFNAASKTNWSLRTFAIVQRELQYHTQEPKWTWKDLI